jgi:SM-20-related protein
MKTITENIEELRELGLFLVPDFFSAGICRQLRNACNVSSVKHAHILISGVATVDTKVRHAECCDIHDHVLNTCVDNRLKSVLPAAAKHYAVELTNYESPQIVRYPAGGFYRPHIDSCWVNSGPTTPSVRKISCVVFLNGSGRSTDNASFVGGSLAFFKLAEDPSEDNCKTLLYPALGLLVAFRSNVYHEVLPVMAGERFSLVTWFR